MPECELCQREVEKISRHHLTPKQKGGKHGATANLCQPCHKTIHHIYSNAELAKSYNTVEKLQEAARLKKYLNWIKDRDIQRLSF